MEATITVAPSNSPSTIAPLPAATDRYRLIEEINRGGMGVIHRAFDNLLEREVALKTVKEGREGEDAFRRFREETLISAQLQHPSIPPIYDFGSLPDGRPFLAMKLIKGQTLEKLLTAGEPMDKLEVFANICQALAYAHSKNVIHRDLKPANIMVGAFGETQVMDWGLAKVIDPASRERERPEEEPEATAIHNPRSGSSSGDSSTQAGLAVGTYAYMPPEQAAGAKSMIGKHSDVFGLGAVLCEMLTGKPPYVKRNKEETASYLAATGKLEDAFTRIEACDAGSDLKAICRRCLDPDPRKRYADAAALADAVGMLQKKLVEDSKKAEAAAIQRRETRKWSRVAIAGILFFATLGFTNYTRVRSKALAERLLDAPTVEVPKLIPQLNYMWAEGVLREAAASDNPRRKLHAHLALLPVDAKSGAYLAERLPVAEPVEVAAIVEALNPFPDAVPKSPNNLRTAAFHGVGGPEVAELLVVENPLHFGAWLEAFRPVAGKLQPGFASIFRDEKRRETERAQAANFLAEYAKDDPVFLADLAMDADETAFRTLYLVLAKHGSKAVDALRAELARKLDDKAPEPDRLRLASRQATAAVTLIRLGKADEAWPLLQFSPDPTVRSWIVHRLKPYGVDAALMRTRFQSEADVSAKRALVLILGEYGQGDAAMIEALKSIYANHPDAGLHAAAEWTLRQWKAEKWISERMKEWAEDKEVREKRLASIINEIKSEPPTLVGGAVRKDGDAKDENGKELRRATSSYRKEARWYVTVQGQPMVVVPGPTEFLMGSPESDPMRFDTEIQHRVRIPRTFAIMARHVTLEEYLRFDASHKIGTVINAGMSPTPDCPAHGMIWSKAAGYCNWLSKREGIREDQWCYETDKEGAVKKPKPNYLSLTGYRLPSEMEMEYEARAGTQSRWCFGEDAALLDRYAWMQRNSSERGWPFGSKKPNDLGFFDGHGNLFAWCTERFTDYKASKDIREDAEDNLMEVKFNVAHSLRGGSWNDRPTILRSAYRRQMLPLQALTTCGIRPARTLPLIPYPVSPSPSKGKE